MSNFVDVLSFLGVLLRLAGLLVFGVASGWFTLFAFRQEEPKWQLQTAVFLGFFLFVALLFRFTSPGGVGAFALGSGIALLYWGLKAQIEPEDDE